jgi:hypothetical protein
MFLTKKMLTTRDGTSLMTGAESEQEGTKAKIYIKTFNFNRT